MGIYRLKDKINRKYLYYYNTDFCCTVKDSIKKSKPVAKIANNLMIYIKLQFSNEYMHSCSSFIASMPSLSCQSNIDSHPHISDK